MFIANRHSVPNKIITRYNQKSVPYYDASVKILAKQTKSPQIRRVPG